MNTLDGTYIFIRKGKPVFWSQGDKNGLVIALSHEDAKKWSSWFFNKHNEKISPYLVGSAENSVLDEAEYAAHDLGERLDVVFVLNLETGNPRFWLVPPEELPGILED